MGTIAIDAGHPGAVIAPRLKERFHFWSGRSGRRHVFTIYGPRAVPDFTNAVVLAVYRRGAVRQVLWSGVATGSFGLCSMEGLHAAIGLGADEVHVHLLAEGGAERMAVLRDFSGPGWPPSPS